MTDTMTLERHIMNVQQDFPDATGRLTSLLYDIALAAKVIAREATHENILERVSPAERQPRATRLAAFASRTLVQLNRRAGRVAAIATEDLDEIVEGNLEARTRYLLLLDPLDGVSPTDYTVSIGTIFGILRHESDSGPITEADFLRRGAELIVAGYVLYGSSTVMVYSSGRGVNGFTLDPGLGEFLLSHEDIQLPSQPHYYSLNHAYDDFWSPGMRRFARYLQGKDSTFSDGLSLRYTGSLVADFHRNLLAGGIFCYPASTMYPEGKLYLGFEANPLAFLVEQAGGAASNGQQRILELTPDHLWQRTPLFVGSRHLVETAETFFQTYDRDMANSGR